MKIKHTAVNQMNANQSRYLFAAQWDDGTYEVIISANGEAERREMTARSIGGPKKLTYGPISRRHTDVNVREHIGARFGVNPGFRCPANDHSNGDRNYGPHTHKDGGYALNSRWL